MSCRIPQPAPFPFVFIRVHPCSSVVQAVARRSAKARSDFGFRPSFGFRISAFGIALGLSFLLSGCATQHPTPPARHFDFSKDTFAYPNELRWVYQFDEHGKWTSHVRDPKPTYWLRCFVMARSTRQFFLNARFAPEQPQTDEPNYRRLIRRVISSSPRHSLPEEKKIVIPGYADLRRFSQDHEKLLKAECGGQLESYFQRGHWRIVMSFSRKGQAQMSDQFLQHLKRYGIVVAHVVRFPSLGINHVLVLFDATESEKQVVFLAYDPNDPNTPTTLTFDRATRTLLLPTNPYFPGGRVDAYEVYHKWNY